MMAYRRQEFLAFFLECCIILLISVAAEPRNPCLVFTGTASHSRPRGTRSRNFSGGFAACATVVLSIHVEVECQSSLHLLHRYHGIYMESMEVHLSCAGF